jgi:hypothetical protein
MAQMYSVNMERKNGREAEQIETAEMYRAVFLNLCETAAR